MSKQKTKKNFYWQSTKKSNVLIVRNLMKEYGFKGLKNKIINEHSQLVCEKE